MLESIIKLRSFFISLIFFSTLTHAEVISLDQRIKQNNKYVASRWRLLNYHLDSFFSNKEYDLEENESSLSASAVSYKKEGNKWVNEFNFRAKIHFPETTKNLKIVIEQDQDDIKKAMSDEHFKSDASESIKSTRASERYSAAVSYLLKNTREFTGTLKFGLRIDMPLNPSVKANFNKLITFSKYSLELSQDFIFYRQAGFSEITAANFGRKWNEVVRTDLINTIAWTDESSLFILRNNFLSYYDLGEERLLTYSLGANAKFKPVWHYDSYDTSISYRTNLDENWLYGSLSFGAEFLKVEDFKMENFVQLKMDMYFN